MFASNQTSASILAAYDDLIENISPPDSVDLEHLRSGGTLRASGSSDSASQGTRCANIIDGVPDGWKVARAHSVMEVLDGGTPMTTVPDYWGGQDSVLYY